MPSINKKPTTDGRPAFSVRPKKSLGQHFLKSKRILALIADVAQIKPDDVVLEIGPGKGALTAKLLEKIGGSSDGSGKVIAVEKDDLLVPYLQELFAKEIASGKLNLIHGDILEIGAEILAKLATKQKTETRDETFDAYSPYPSYKLVANIPYYITGALLRMFLSAEHPPETMVLMLQKEVARRIMARDGKESLLSLSVKVYGTPKYIETVKAENFSPKPNVDSAVLLIENISKNFFRTFTEEKFFTIIRAGFAHKRKLLARNLESASESGVGEKFDGKFDPKKIATAFTIGNLNTKSRSEDLPLEKWKILTENL